LRCRYACASSSVVIRPELDRRRTGEELRLLDGALHPRLDHVLTQRSKQQEAAEETENDDQQRRDEANEDVTENQLAANAPQEPPSGKADQAADKDRQPQQQRERAGGAHDVEHEVPADAAREDECDQPDRGADQYRASGPCACEQRQRTTGRKILRVRVRAGRQRRHRRKSGSLMIS
jgi:hypothetical protein